MFECNELFGKSCEGRIIESVGETKNILVHYDEDGKEYISFDAIVYFTDGGKGIMHIPKAYLEIDSINIGIDANNQVSPSMKKTLTLKSVWIGCKNTSEFFDVTPIPKMNKAEVEDFLNSLDIN